MSASLSGVFSLQEFSDAGVLLTGGRIYTYVAGTTTFKTAYTDSAAAVPHTYTSDGLGGQYIALNARGEIPAPLFLTAGAYDIALKRADGSTVWTRQAIPSSDVSSLSDSTSATAGAGVIGYGSGLAYPASTVGGVLNGQGAAANFRSNLLLAGNGGWANPAIGDAQHLLEIVNDNSAYQCAAMTAYGALTNGNNFHWNRCRGTLAAPTAIQSGDYFMSHGYRGWDGTATLSQSMAAFQYQANQNWTATAHGGLFKFELAKTNGSSRLPAWKLYAGAADGVIMELGDETALASRILNASTTGFLQIHGSQDQTGAQMILYGNAHATLPNQAWVRGDIISVQDRSGNETLNVNALTQQLLIKGTGGFGYTAGAGLSATQPTSKTDGVLANVPAVKVTMNAAALAGGAVVSFTWTSSKIGSDDQILVNQVGGAASIGSYRAWSDLRSTGSARIVLENRTGGSLSEAVVLQLTVLKSASS